MADQPVLLDSGDATAIASAARALRAGGIVGIPTETVYGLAVLPRPAGLAALIALKRRPPGKGIALLVDGLDQVADLVTVPAPARRLAVAHWPGPLTLVLPLRPGADLPDALTGGGRTLGVRVPDHAVPRALARSLGPIAVSSANLSGEPEARSASELLDSVGASLSLVIDGGPVREGGRPSTVVAVPASGRLELLRAGALDYDALIRTAAGSA